MSHVPSLAVPHAPISSMQSRLACLGSAWYPSRHRSFCLHCGVFAAFQQVFVHIDTFFSATCRALIQRHATGGATTLSYISAYVSMRRVASWCGGCMAEVGAETFHPSDLLTSLTKSLPSAASLSGINRRNELALALWHPFAVWKYMP